MDKNGGVEVGFMTLSHSLLALETHSGTNRNKIAAIKKRNIAGSSFKLLQLTSSKYNS